MNIQKIEKPENGWTREYLKTLNGHFAVTNTAIINKYSRVIFMILNDCLPYFYISDNFQYIFINEEYFNNLKKRSKKNQFDKVVIEYIFNHYQIIGNNETIEQVINNFEQRKKEKEKEIQEKLLKKAQEKQQYLEEYQKRKQQFQHESEQQKENTINRQQEIQHIYENEKGGIYSICSKDFNGDMKLLYIGRTDRNFEERWQEHKDIVYGKEPVQYSMKKCYNLLKEERQIKECLIPKKMLSFNELSANKPLTLSEKEAIEMAFIHYFQPPGNKAGIDIPYIFKYDGNNELSSQNKETKE